MNPTRIKGIKKDGLTGQTRQTYLANIKPKIEYLHHYADSQRGVTRVATLAFQNDTTSQ
jgi:hypothetical protein